MGTLKAELTKEDIETLIEAMDDWEMIGNHEFHVMSAIKNAPMPPEDMEEHHEAMKRLKDMFRKREKEIKETRQVRQERAILTKARLVMIKQDLAIGKLFDASCCSDTEPSAATATELDLPQAPAMTVAEVSKLALAEEFIRDLGVQSHYDKFLADREAKTN